MKRVLLVGGGQTHAGVLRAGVQGEATLVTPYAHHVYSGMLPGFVAGHYRLEEMRIDVAALAARAGARLVLGRVAALDARRRVARLEDGAEIEYDVASLDVGAPAAAPEYALAVKPFETFMEHWLEVKERVRAVAVVGAGAAGVEIAMAVAHRTNARVTLYADRLVFRPGLARRIARQLARNGVELRADVAFAEGMRKDHDLVVWTASAAAPPWLRASGLAVDERGCVRVDDRLRSVSHPEVFAVGDCVGRHDAARHAPVLAANLGGAEKRYAPQRRALALISCGERYAIADWYGMSVEGAWAWRWKDRIDRRWVEQFRL